jgi:hypothetical protein
MQSGVVIEDVFFGYLCIEVYRNEKIQTNTLKTHRGDCMFDGLPPHAFVFDIRVEMVATVKSIMHEHSTQLILHKN